mgnify:CR=1 FL=1
MWVRKQYFEKFNIDPVNVVILFKKRMAIHSKKTIDDAYNEIMKQVENFKKYDD